MSDLTLTYEHERGEKLWTIVYEVEPYDPGYLYDRNGDGCPPSGGTATILEIRHADGSKLPDDSWAPAGFDEDEIERLEEQLYQDWTERPEPEPCRCRGEKCWC